MRLDLDNSRTIETFELTRTFGDVAAVRGLTISVPAGQVFGLLGPNGSGKTTTIRMLTTLLPPTSGTAVVAGADVRSRPADVRARIGVALQQTGLDPVMTAAQLLRLQASLHGERAGAARRRASELTEALRLTEHANRPVAQLSGGLRRRVDLAVALVHRPAVLFLDEPTTGLDPASRRDLWELIRVRAADGTTIVLTTQYLEEADQLADHVAILRDGTLVASASPDKLKREVGERSLILGLADEDVAARAAALLSHSGNDAVLVPPKQVRVRLVEAEAANWLRVLADADLEVTSLETAEPSLEDVFLRLAAA
jgi:ABC-type multidrug transport system ATPase subunit